MKVWYPAAFFLAIAFMPGCAPSMRSFEFEYTSPLFARKIGLLYDRKLIGTFEGLDDHDSQEYLSALCAALDRYSKNATFIDLTQSGVKIARYKPFTVKKIGLLGDTTAVGYMIPDSGFLQEFEDSLDYVMLLQNLTVMRVTPIEMETDYSVIHMDPFKKGSISSNYGMIVPFMRVVESDSQEVTHLGYILWDFKKNEVIGYEGKSLSRQMFMDKNTTFAQDAELTSQRVLKELQNSFVASRNRK